MPQNPKNDDSNMNIKKVKPKSKAEISKPKMVQNHINLEDVCDILDKVTEEFLKDDAVIYYGLMLAKEGLYRGKLHYWAKNHSEVAERLNILRDLQSAKYKNTLVSDTTLNPSNLIWFGKTNLGMMEEYNKQRLAQDTRANDLYEQEISIGFEDDEDNED